MQLIPNTFIDLTITSPPYDNLRDYNGYTFNFDDIANQLFRVTKEGGVIVWICNDATINGSESGTSFRQALKFMEIGFRLHDTMIWKKDSFSAVGALKNRYSPVFEYMFILSKGAPSIFNPICDHKNKSFGKKLVGTIRQKNGDMKRMSNEGKVCKEFGRRFNVWEINSEHKLHTGHPAPFPEQLVRDHIISWSDPGCVVLDPMCGSGTTCKVAYENNRHYIGIDISSEYIEIARKRIQSLPIRLDLFEQIYNI